MIFQTFRAGLVTPLHQPHTVGGQCARATPIELRVVVCAHRYRNERWARAFNVATPSRRVPATACFCVAVNLR